MDATVRVRQRCTLTLPAELREKCGIETGDTFCLVDLYGIFVLTPMVAMVPESWRARLNDYAFKGVPVTHISLLSLFPSTPTFHRPERSTA